jgi:hypothetical protein
MGGMYTNIKVREKVEDYSVDPGWYQKPAGTLAEIASEAELKRDLGFLPDAIRKGTAPPKHQHG